MAFLLARRTGVNPRLLFRTFTTNATPASTPAPYTYEAPAPSTPASSTPAPHEKLALLDRYLRDKHLEKAQSLFLETKNLMPEEALACMFQYSARYRRAAAFTAAVTEEILPFPLRLSVAPIFDSLLVGLETLGSKKLFEALRPMVVSMFSTPSPQMTRWKCAEIHWLQREGKIEEAVKLVEVLQSESKPNVMICNAELSLWISPLNTSKFQEVWQRMQANKIRPNDKTLYILLSMFRASKSVNEALRIFYQLPRTYGFQPSVGNYTTIISICNMGNNHGDILRLINLGEAAHLQLPPFCFEQGLVAARKLPDFQSGAKILARVFDVNDLLDNTNNHHHHTARQQVAHRSPMDSLSAMANYPEGVHPAVVDKKGRMARNGKKESSEVGRIGASITKMALVKFVQAAEFQRQYYVVSPVIEAMKQRYGVDYVQQLGLLHAK